MHLHLPTCYLSLEDCIYGRITVIVSIFVLVGIIMSRRIGQVFLNQEI